MSLCAILLLLFTQLLPLFPPTRAEASNWGSATLAFPGEPNATFFQPEQDWQVPPAFKDAILVDAGGNHHLLRSQTVRLFVAAAGDPIEFELCRVSVRDGNCLGTLVVCLAGEEQFTVSLCPPGFAGVKLELLPDRFRLPRWRVPENREVDLPDSDCVRVGFRGGRFFAATDFLRVPLFPAHLNFAPMPDSDVSLHVLAQIKMPQKCSLKSLTARVLLPGAPEPPPNDTSTKSFPFDPLPSTLDPAVDEAVDALFDTVLYAVAGTLAGFVLLLAVPTVFIGVQEWRAMRRERYPHPRSKPSSVRVPVPVPSPVPDSISSNKKKGATQPPLRRVSSQSERVPTEFRRQKLMPSRKRRSTEVPMPKRNGTRDSISEVVGEQMSSGVRTPNVYRAVGRVTPQKTGVKR